MEDIEKIIKQTNEQNKEKIDWTKAWSEKYPVLATYRDKVDVEKYAKEIRKLLESLQQECQYTQLDAMLVLKRYSVSRMEKSKEKINEIKRDEFTHNSQFLQKLYIYR